LFGLFLGLALRQRREFFLAHEPLFIFLKLLRIRRLQLRKIFNLKFLRLLNLSRFLSLNLFVVVDKAKLYFGVASLIVHFQVVRCQRVSILKHEHVALSLVTDVMILFVVLSQHLCVCKHFKFWQVVRLARDLAHATALPPTHITKEVLFTVVKVQLVNVVEKLVLTEKAPGVLLSYVALEGVVLVKRVLEH
jgi:hypothetical protein